VGTRDAQFFFSSRRRHTIFSRDWSSDVCSSDLGVTARIVASHPRPANFLTKEAEVPVEKSRAEKEELRRSQGEEGAEGQRTGGRSEERRAGKESRARRAATSEKEKRR